MAENSMSAENGSQPPEQILPQAQEFGSQPLNFAAEGVGFGNKPNILQATFGEVPANTIPPAPGRGPSIEHNPNKNPFGGIKGKIAAGLAAIGIAGGGAFMASQVLNSDGEDDPKGVAAANVTPILEPTNNPTVEATPTVESKKIEKYPLELGFIQDFGNTTISIQKQLQEVGVVDDPNQGKDGVRKDGIKVNEVYLNKKDYSDAEIKLNQGILYGHYLAWKTEGINGRNDIDFELFKEKVAHGEDMTYKIQGYKGESILDYGEITIDPKKRTNIVLLSSPTALLSPFAGYKYGHRLINGELYLEIFDYNGFDINDKSEYKKSESTLAYDIQWALALLSDRESQDARVVTLDGYKKNQPIVYEFDKFLIPSKSSTRWNSILRVK
ncbi:MAG: hypothetical protein Q7T54_01205 [Candidatus Levybacteria bacterium]|nr:hypothetical protein [Candidatus Levybacteria bacterium]